MKENENIKIPNEFDNVTEIENTASYRILSTQNINEHPQKLKNLFDFKKIDNFKDKIELNKNILSKIFNLDLEIKYFHYMKS